MIRYYKTTFKNQQTGVQMYSVRLTPYSVIDEESACDYSVHNSNINRQELRAGFSALNQAIENFVLNGNNIILTDLGLFYTSVRTGKWDAESGKWVSGGADTMDDVDNANIRTLSIRFRPCTSLKNQMSLAKFAEISTDGDLLGRAKSGNLAIA